MSFPDQITLVTDDFSGPKVSEKFFYDLKQYDPTLLVRWNSRKMRFVVEQCTHHHAPTAEHSHLCERIYVFLVQDDDGCMMSLGGQVLEKIKARDVTKAGYGPNDLRRFLFDASEPERKAREKIDRDQTDAVKHCSRDGRAQVIRAFNMLNNCGTPNR
jgi:hypothetical protein